MSVCLPAPACLFVCLSICPSVHVGLSNNTSSILPYPRNDTDTSWRPAQPIYKLIASVSPNLSASYNYALITVVFMPEQRIRK
ncbi:hypothetical protein BDV93DRAFT_223434 [Ceratobasidium sp. AG-I]|nr:hypothetical protein BDV93DRAFT_223434 [Ceratobasidium sp. AG-I]